MRRWLWVMVLPLVWVPMLGVAIIAAQSLPWWALLFAVIFWVLVWRRRRDAGAGEGAGPLDPSAPAFSPLKGGGL